MSTMPKTELSDEDIRAIAALASTIDERREGLVEIAPPADDPERERMHDLLSAWRESAAGGDAVLFAERLRRDGLDEQTAFDLLGRASLPAGSPLPGWAATFQRIIVQTGEPPPPPKEDTDQTPFAELLWPIVVSARPLLAKKVADTMARHFAPPAIAALERSLLLRLAELCGPGLFGDFNLYRHLARRQKGRFFLPFSPAGSRLIFDAYVAAWREGGMRQFFLDRPVTARLIGVAASHWVDGAADLVERLARDRAAIGRMFSPGTEVGLVETMKTDLSDPHRGGRTVTILTFASGLSVVHKPKDLRIDIAWSNLLGWMNEHGAPTALSPVRVLDRDGYGWCEFVVADDRAAGRDQSLYYRRAGGLLAMLHLVRASDLHYENVIPAGGLPAPVDLECLLRPDLANTAGVGPAGAAGDLAQSLLRNSVLTTHFLPTWAPGLAGAINAIGGVEELDDRRAPKPRFLRVNTDSMALAPASTVDPAVDGATQVSIHFRDFIAGFDELYAFLIEQRASLLDPEGPLTPFHAVVIRVLLNSTAVYSLVQRRARSFTHLADGAAWSLNFEYLMRADLAAPAAPNTWAMRAAERRAAAACDIPMFTARADAAWLESEPGQRIEACLTAPPFDQLLARVRRLGEDDRALQARIIASTISQPRVEEDERPSPGGAASDRVLTEMAIRLGDMLDDAAFRAGDGAAWYGVVPLDHEHREVSVLGLDLMSGATGIALFCAALAQISGEARFRDLALSAIAPGRAYLASAGRRFFANAIGLGGGTGIGSIIYGLVRVSALLDEPSILEDARAVAGLVDPELIAADRWFDVFRGAAGAILGLLALERASGDQAALDAARACGRHLLAARVKDPDGELGWSTMPTYEGRHLTGFSHGAAGFALALLRLYRATGEAAYRSTAEDALAYERKLFRPDLNNWPDLRFRPPPDGVDGPCQWCHGAAGIGLARLGCLDLIDDKLIMGEIEAALSSTLAARPKDIDFLCCGNFGRLDFLLAAGLRLERPDLVACARTRATERVEQATARGQFIWGGADDRMNPGFFQGVSGIGYELLRLTTPQALPSVLLWD
jgi:type 2 lantibiotic biosynthesis protein LanM